jgi:arylsulfatase A-like enzyme
MKRSLLKIFTLTCSCLILFSCSPAVEKPNIIVIMADDLGYGDVSSYGATAVYTPNIDKLASGGLKFTGGYCTAATCTPTRFSFLTGMYAFRQEGTGIAPPESPSLIKPGTPTLPGMLRKAGYKTAVIGKWHLGLGDPKPQWNDEINPGPLEIGFDYCYLLPTTNDRVPSVYVENHRVANLDPADPLIVGEGAVSDTNGKTFRHLLKMDWSHGHNQTIHNGISRIGWFKGGHAARWRDEDLGDQFVRKSVEWITENQDAPFFLFFSSQDIHVPRMPNERFHGATDMGFRGDAIVELDYKVGAIIDVLEELDLAEQTLIVFCSDNGPVLDDGYKDGAIEMLGDHKPAGPYRGGKYSPYEGGTRTPYITYWPGNIAPGTSDAMVSTVDLAVSLNKLAGNSVPAGTFPDSYNVIDALLGQKGAQGRTFIFEEAVRSFGLRKGDWKLVDHQTEDQVQRLTYFKPAGHRYELYNLSDDPAEENNIIAEHPDVAGEMMDQYEKIKKGEISRPD